MHGYDSALRMAIAHRKSKKHESEDAWASKKVMMQEM